MNLGELPVGSVASVIDVGGEGSFRRRLLELGMLPGTRVEVLGIAPLGDPMELLVRGATLSIRRADAGRVEVNLLAGTRPSLASAPVAATDPRNASSLRGAS